MKKKQFTLLLFALIALCSKAQTTVMDDVVILKTGQRYEGLIIEQRPSSSIKFVVNYIHDTLVFSLDQIAIMQKQARKVEQSIPQTTVPAQETKQPTVAYAQEATYQTGNDLTIFSDDEYKFRVYINGKPYNQNFATRVAIENINHNWVRVGVLFEDPMMGVIEEDITLSNYNSMLPYTSTYIVQNKKGKLKLKDYNYSVKKVAPGSANVLIHQSAVPNVRVGVSGSMRIGR